MWNIFYKSQTDKFFHSHTYDEVNDNKSIHHHNNHYEILVFIKGNCRFEVEGFYYDLKPYDILILQPAEMHRIHHLEPNEPYERYVYHIWDTFFVKNDCEEMKKIFTSRSLGVNNVISGELVKDHYIMDILKAADSYVTEYNPVPENVLRGKLVELLFHLNQLHGKTIHEGQTGDNIREIIMYINENIGKNLKLSDIADHFFISKSHLCHLFKKNTGLTVNQYIKQKQFIKVKEFRAEGMSLTDASVKAGFGTYSNFYKMYLNETGRAPSEDM